MGSRIEKFQALPRGGQVFVVIALVALGVWLYTSMGDESAEVSACEAFSDLAEDVQAGRVDANSMEVIDRMEGIGEQLQESTDVELAGAGRMAASAAQAARPEPDVSERDKVMVPAVERLTEVCS